MKIHFKRGKALLAFFAAVTMLFMLFPLNLNMVASAGSTVIGVVNGGFEDGTNGWELSANKTNATAINRDAHSGSMSLLLDFPMAWGAAATQFVNVEKNTDYIVSFWAKRVSGTGAWNLYVMKDDASTNMNVTGGTWFNQTTTDWKLISYQFNSGDEEKVFLKFGPESNDAGTFLVDDVAVTKKGTGLFNGDFENGSLGWTLGGDTKITNDAHSGRNALELSYPTAWGAAATQVVSVEKNTNYIMSFWTKRVSGAGAWHFSVMDNTASHANVPLTEGGTWFNQTTTDWKQVTYEFNSGNLTEVFLKFNPEIKDAGVFHVDDILLTKKPGVVNGGFEKGTNGWELSANKTNATAINRDAHSGSKALLLDFPSAWGAAATQYVNVEKNTDYIVSFWAKRVDGKGAWNLYVMKDDASTNMSVTGGTWFNQTTTDWKLISYQFNSGDEEKVFLKFGPESNDAGTFLVDDVAVTEKGTGLFNGDFEIDSLGWTLGGATKITDDAHAGQKALELSYPTAWGAAATQVVSVEKNTNYTISFWTKRVSGTGAWHFSVMDNSASHANVPLTEGGTWFNQTTTDWKQVTYEFNSGNLTEVFLKFNPEIKDAGVFHVDDVLLTKKLGVANGSFEQGTNGWTLSSAETNKTAISDDAHGGNKALLLDYPSAWGAAATQYVNVKKDTKYTVMFWTKRVSGTGAWDLYVMKGDLSGNMPVVGDMYFNQTTNEWKQISFYFNSGDEEKVFLKFAPESNSSGTFLVDDVSIVVKEDVYGVKNGGFESGSEEWKLSGNTAISEDAYSGEKALLLSFSQQWGVAAIQTIQVKKDTEYVLSFWTKRVSGNGAWHLCVVDPKDNYKELTYTGGEKWFNHTDGLWHKSRVEFNSGDREELCLKITPEDTNSVFLIDDIGVYVKGTEPPDLPKPKALTLTSFGVDTNRPVSADANLLKNASFEATEGAQWNVTTFLNDTLKVVDDETAPDGKKSLYFDTSAVTSAAWHVFWVDVEPGKDYTFSGWVKGAFLADDNRAQGTFGVIDPDTGKFLIYSPNANRTSKETLQLQPTAWDNEWHLRSVTFNSGEKKKVGIAVYGHSSKMWIDDIALYEVSDGVKYVSKLATSSITPKFDVQHSSCADEDNLINDATLSSKDGKAFWTSGAGWKNAFMSIRESKYEYGDSLRYVGSEDSKGISYIKWIDVEPNTNYTFSAKLKVLQDGDGKLVLMDNKMTGAANFIEVDFDSENYGNDWFSFAINFNSDVFTRIGISVVDLGGEVLLDNIRLFETDKGIDATDTYVEPPEEGEDPDTPNTGFNMAGALVAGALIPASAAVMAKLDRKKRKRQNG